MTTMTKLAALLLSGFFLAACESDGPMENAGEELDDAAEEVQEETDEAIDEMDE